jgi:hypothetical protein
MTYEIKNNIKKQKNTVQMYNMKLTDYGQMNVERSLITSTV